ncbi:unnamed protein product [Ilex paraguariensis]|uniref:Uncharacterized protein n=1 Tax=Ilex paraguariensis TaxID=185542 RepID=A0ABC8TBB8_9AQUA
MVKLLNVFDNVKIIYFGAFLLHRVNGHNIGFCRFNVFHVLASPIHAVSLQLMAVTTSIVQSYSPYFSETCLRVTITLEAGRKYRNVLSGKMRFTSILYSKSSKLCSRSKHKFVGKLLQEVDGYDSASDLGRAKLLNKVS